MAVKIVFAILTAMNPIAPVSAVPFCIIITIQYSYSPKEKGVHSYAIRPNVNHYYNRKILFEIKEPTPSKRWLPLLLSIILLLGGLYFAVGYGRLSSDDVALVESTPAQLFLWMAQQSTKAEPASPLVRLGKVVAGGTLSDEMALGWARAVMVGLGGLTAVFATISAILIAKQSPHGRNVALLLLLICDLLLFAVPPDAAPFYGLTLGGIVFTLLLLYFAPGKLSKTFGFLIIISSILVSWELYKALGALLDNRLPLTDYPWKLPHWQHIAVDFLQPARRNGEYLLVRILAEAAMVTWREAFIGFAIGSVLGFSLGVMFARFELLERSLLPYVIASQTIPIIAIAPMIVAFLGQGLLPVAFISAYLTFFPVTVNTLRGLQSPSALKVDLMRSYAAAETAVLWKLRVPSAMPFIFTALKVSATASVVGAIVGELPSSRSDGLAAAILRASGNYAAEPEKLWAAIIMSSFVGIGFFAIVSLAEKVALRGFEPNGTA